MRQRLRRGFRRGSRTISPRRWSWPPSRASPRPSSCCSGRPTILAGRFLAAAQGFDPHLGIGYNVSMYYPGANENNAYQTWAQIETVTLASGECRQRVGGWLELDQHGRQLRLAGAGLARRRHHGHRLSRGDGCIRLDHRLRTAGRDRLPADHPRDSISHRAWQTDSFSPRTTSSSRTIRSRRIFTAPTPIR